MTEDLKALDTGVSCHCDRNWMWRGVDQTTDGSGDVFQHVTDKQISSENRARGRKAATWERWQPIYSRKLEYFYEL